MITLRPYQKEAVQAHFKFLIGNPVIVLPTGSGKTIVLGEIVSNIKGGVLILSHVKEILTQNYESLNKMLDEPIGLYSAGLNIKHIERVTVASIHSVYKIPELFSHVKHVIVDECHLISNTGMYRSLLTALNVTCTGLTASPFRMLGGYIYGQPDSFFKGVCYSAEIGELQKQGFISKIQLIGAQEGLDTTGVKITGGDFNSKDMSLKYDRTAITEKIVKQLLPYKNEYKHWLLFAIDIAHAENIAEALNNIGVTAEAVHSKSPRDKAIQDFKKGDIQALVNVNILTTGFDYPKIDFIILLRPTKSPVLHVQMVGRGLRIAPGKSHCLVKDFAGNFARLGPLEDVYVAGKKKRGKGPNPFMKECPTCLAIVHPSIKVCECGYKFKFKHNLSTTAYIEDKIEWYDVTKVSAYVHRKTGKPESVKLTYRCGMRVFNDWVLIEHPGWAGHKARYWVQQHWVGEENRPITAKEICARFHEFKLPNKIKVNSNSKYPRIVQTN